MFFYPIIKPYFQIIIQKHNTQNLQQKYITIQHNGEIKITFYTSSRKNDNISYNMEHFLVTILDTAVNIENIEILIAVDEDDDLQHFEKLVETFHPFMNIRVIISNTRYGSQKLHLYDKILFDNISSTTKMLIDCSDDAEMLYRGWDNDVLEIDAKIPDNIYFIHTNDFQMEKYAGKIGDNIAKMIWLHKAVAPASYFPIISRKVLEIAHEALEWLPENERNDWSPVTNGRNCDCYIDIIAHLVQSRITAKRVFHFNMMRIPPFSASPSEKDVMIFHKDMNICWDKKSINTNDVAFLKLLEPSTLSHLQLIANKLSNVINATK